MLVVNVTESLNSDDHRGPDGTEGSLVVFSSLLPFSKSLLPFSALLTTLTFNQDQFSEKYLMNESGDFIVLVFIL